jgi:hypothetical protein
VASRRRLPRFQAAEGHAQCTTRQVDRANQVRALLRKLMVALVARRENIGMQEPLRLISSQGAGDFRKITRGVLLWSRHERRSRGLTQSAAGE